MAMNQANTMDTTHTTFNMMSKEAIGQCSEEIESLNSARKINYFRRTVDLT